MARLAMLVRDGRIESAFEYCAMAVLITLIAIGGSHAFGTRLGIVVNNVSALAG